MAHEKTFIIDGMSCGGCVNSLTRVLKSTPGIEPLKVEVGKATLRLDESVTTDTVKAAVDRAGFEVVREA
ncbi:MAG TPA: heavy metal-associated domain-containing protein [Vicinamibacterales bacterium]|nr:heavy metal-associated domain-containing protein [Vicinamibacterales bacterium]